MFQSETNSLSTENVGLCREVVNYAQRVAKASVSLASTSAVRGAVRIKGLTNWLHTRSLPQHAYSAINHFTS